jgi:ferredoxin
MPNQSPYKKFAEMMLHQDSVWIPKILSYMIREPQADLLVSLPATARDAAEKLNRSIESVERDLKDLFFKGLVFKKEKEGSTVWRPPAHIVQFHDASILWPEATQAFYDLWQAYMEKEWPKLAHVLMEFMPRPFTRVIPVGKSIDTGTVQVLAPENVKRIIENAELLAVTKCTCRLTMKKCDSPIEVCLQIDRGAAYTIERGSGRKITKDEALDIIRQTETAGLVHVTMNKAGIGHFICNCCGCCCQAFSLLIADGLSLCDPSRYRPAVQETLCTGCETCVERCWFGAIGVDNGIAAVDEDKCLGCGQCAVGCPESAISLIEAREPGFIPD